MADEWIVSAAELRSHFGTDKCECCGRTLKTKARMLEHDMRTGTYHDFGGVPDASSRGWHPLGLACAKRKLAEARAVVSAEGIPA